MYANSFHSMDTTLIVILSLSVKNGNKLPQGNQMNAYSLPSNISEVYQVFEVHHQGGKDACTGRLLKSLVTKELLPDLEGLQISGR